MEVKRVGQVKQGDEVIGKCVEKLNAKQDELQKEYDQEMEKWCKQKGVNADG